MRKLSVVLASILGACTMQSSASANDLVDLYEYLHANPELSLVETKTAAFLGEKFEKLGFDVTYKVGGTGVVALMKNGEGPTVMIRADMDALPVKEQTGLSYASKVMTKDYEGNEQPAMHACGHDVHMTVLHGTAEKLVASKDNWSGTLMMILQPAEELGKGARDMLADGLFERFPRPDYNLTLHDNASLAAGQVGIVPGFAMANVDSVDITVRGIGGHGAYPHTTKDPVVLAAQIVMALQTIVSREISPLEPAVVTVGSIHGGTKHNIISNEVKLQLTLRSYTDEVRDQTLSTIRRIAKGLGESYGLPEDKLPIVVHKDEFTPALYNDPELAARMMPVIGKAIGEDNVKELKPVMGGEDFGQFGRVDPKIPSLLFWLGAVSPDDIAEAKKTGKTLPSLHSPFFAPDAKPTLETGVAAMTAAALDLLNSK
ncbi:MAG: amidohydrolase [Hyphomonadaceae bacterium]|nr:amidohydrolase [Hyphomonadaceae bacterium]